MPLHSIETLIVLAFSTSTDELSAGVSGVIRPDEKVRIRVNVRRLLLSHEIALFQYLNMLPSAIH